MGKVRRLLGFIAIAAAMFMGMLDGTIVNIALPDITSYFHEKLNDTSWISTIYVLSLAVFMITASKIADQFGRKKVMLAGLFIFGASSAMCGLSDSLMFLIAMRGIQGIGGAIITPLVVPMAMDAFGKEKTTLVGGAIGAITALAAAGGPPIGGLLIEYINWQAIFFINVPVAFISLILTIFFVRESYDHTASKKVDGLGMILLSAFLFLLTFALLKGNDYGWASVAIIAMFAGSAVSLVLFIITELKSKSPMVEFNLFHESTFTASAVCYLIAGFAVISPGLIFNYFLQNVMGYEVLHAALVVTPMALTVIVSMPLGSIISKKLDARLVNFLGIFGMGIGAFLLSRLTINTPESLMIVLMIVFGFALGFAVQSLISSIKYLPEEKSGLGSGIVNAARQVGMCIGIALLVSTLTLHVNSAKDTIQSSAIADIKSHNDIAESVRKVMMDDINDSFKNNDTDNLQQSGLKDKLEKDIKSALTSLGTAERPVSNEVLEDLYDGASTLSDGAAKTAGGQKDLDRGISDLQAGIDKLYDGSTTLAAGLEALDSGLGKAQEGSGQLKAAGAQGSSALSSGIGQLDAGAQKMLKQFSHGTDAGSPTIYDGVNGISRASESLSASTEGYVAAVDNTIYMMIKNDPTSPQLLSGYKDSLKNTQAAYAKANEADKPKYLQQLQGLSNLVNIYTAAVDPTVKSAADFEAKLVTLAQQDESGATVVSAGAKVVKGAQELEGASKQVAAQFSDGGAFKTGIVQLADGAGKLSQAAAKLPQLQDGISQLADSLTQAKAASAKLASGARDLQQGAGAAKSGSSELKAGSEKLADASGKIRDGATELMNGIGTAGQKDEITSILDKMNSDKDDKIVGAFSRTFSIAAIILILSSVFGLFTDKKALDQQ